MSKKDKARMEFVRSHRRKQQVVRSIKNQIIMEGEKLKDMAQGLSHTKKMTYKELVEDMNQDLRAIQQIETPMMLFKEEKAMVE